MNFAQMLMREVTPLSKYNPRRDKLTYNTQVAATVRASKTKGAYQAVMEGKGWILASVVEQALGYKPRTAIKWLHTAHALGYVEKRKSKLKGILWEWRWAE